MLVNNATKVPVTNKNNKPVLSIGMPVYNGEKLIRKAIESLLSQTFTYFELIISDNASTDNTETICRDYSAKDARISYVRQPYNRGGGQILSLLWTKPMVSILCGLLMMINGCLCS